MIDVQALRALAKEQRITAGLMEYLSSRQRHTWETSVESAMRATGGSRADVIANFKKLAELNLGHLTVGRKGHKTRFEWAVYPGQIAKAAAGEIDELEGENAAGSDTADDDTELLLHTYQLRRNLEITIDLPSDLTEKEAAKLARWIETLPFTDD